MSDNASLINLSDIVDIDTLWERISKMYIALGKKGDLVMYGYAPVNICYCNCDDLVFLAKGNNIREAMINFHNMLQDEVNTQVSRIRKEADEKIKQLQGF